VALTFPVRIKAGSTTITIFQSPLKTEDKEYDSYVLSYYEGNKRIRRRFSDYGTAKLEGGRVAAKLINTDTRALQLTGEDARIFSRAKEAVSDLQVPLDLVAVEYAEACKVLGGKRILEAAKFFIKHSASALKEGTIPELVAEYRAQTEADGRSEYHLRDLRLRLGRFARDFTGSLSSLTSDQINTWLRNLDGSMRTRKNYRETIRTFFHHLQRKGYLARGLPTAADDTSIVNVPDSEVSVLTPNEMQLLLDLAPKRILPTLVLKAFSGIRTEELWRMQWENIDFDQGFIRLTGSITKTGQKRLVPIAPNLKVWLRPYQNEKGKICARWKNSHTLTDAWYVFGQQVGVSVGDNKLRHSFISYRVAQTSDIAKVASEAGNSIRIIQKNYLELVTPKQAKEWFSINPMKKKPKKDKESKQSPA